MSTNRLGVTFNVTFPYYIQPALLCRTRGQTLSLIFRTVQVDHRPARFKFNPQRTGMEHKRLCVRLGGALASRRFEKAFSGLRTLPMPNTTQITYCTGGHRFSEWDDKLSKKGRGKHWTSERPGRTTEFGGDENEPNSRFSLDAWRGMILTAVTLANWLITYNAMLYSVFLSFPLPLQCQPHLSRDVTHPPGQNRQRSVDVVLPDFLVPSAEGLSHHASIFRLFLSYLFIFRLKLRCDRGIPCGSCLKRGCGAICPDGTYSTHSIDTQHRLIVSSGSLTTGQGNR